MNAYKKYLKKCKAEDKKPVSICQWIANKENGSKRWGENFVRINEHMVLIKK